MAANSRSSQSLSSMTGFARASHEGDSYGVSVEVRSVNHRYLDVRAKLPQALSSLEKRVRDRVSEFLARGKVDVTIHLTAKGDSAYALEVDQPLLADYVRAVRDLASQHELEGALSVSELVAFSPAFKVRERDLTDASPVWASISPALEKALTQHETMRRAEGEALARDLRERTQRMADHLDRVESVSESGRTARREQLVQKVEELAGAALEAQALAMEVTRVVERSDIAEELTRARSHLELWSGTVETGGACGKKLDFIVQELNREFNTIGSKCQDAELTELVIALKSELERIREQVQNIE